MPNMPASRWMKIVVSSTTAVIFLAVSLQAAGVESVREQELIQAARSGRQDAILKLANAYADGTDGCPQDYRKAIDWYEKCAQLGNGEAMARIGIFTCLEKAYRKTLSKPSRG